MMFFACVKEGKEQPLIDYIDNAPPADRDLIYDLLISYDDVHDIMLVAELPVDNKLDLEKYQDKMGPNLIKHLSQ